MSAFFCPSKKMWRVISRRRDWLIACATYQKWHQIAQDRAHVWLLWKFTNIIQHCKGGQQLRAAQQVAVCKILESGMDDCRDYVLFASLSVSPSLSEHRTNSRHVARFIPGLFSVFSSPSHARCLLSSSPLSTPASPYMGQVCSYGCDETIWLNALSNKLGISSGMCI